MTKPKAAKFLQRPQQNANSHNHGTSASSDHGGDLQEQFQRLYSQLETLKDRNLRLGNRQMVVCASFHEEVEAERPLCAKDPQHQGPKGRGPKNVNLLRKSVSKEEILDKGGGRRGKDINHLRKSASKEENISCGVGNSVREVGVLRKVDNKEDFPGKSRRRDSHPQRTKTESKVSPRLPGFEDGSTISPPDDYVHLRSDTSSDSVDAETAEPHDMCGPNGAVCEQCVSREILSSSRSSTNQSDDATRSPSSSRELKPLGHRSAEFLLRKSVSTELSDRVCRSLEYLDETGTRCGGPIGGTGGCGGNEEDLSIEDRSVRSAHSTPRRSGGRRFREIHDPERARAFILYNLSDRATLTDEVTV
ncbi:hypothetical protein Hamer_G017474 [Homarus americanus]|uniref:Uncharacterized protein n=1 Tax=Homarus americanus TaxID=6706 RepID=A0A8J5JK41_HOMAM|nr:hypothetical protein Hamer_G017474 [Homarus americanus]